MNIVRSTLDGVGGAGGVAWPLFGLITTAYVLGGTLLHIVGGVCVGIFLAVATPIIVQNYRRYQHEKQDALEKKNKMASRSIFASNLSMLEENKKYSSKTNKEIHLFNEFITYANTQSSSLSNQVLLNDFINQQKRKKPVSLLSVVFAFFTGFVGGFGTIAGGSLGVSGLVNTIFPHVITGLAITAGINPILLPIIALALASFIGLCNGFFTAYAYVKNKHLQDECKLLERLTQGLDCQQLVSKAAEKKEESQGNEYAFPIGFRPPPQTDLVKGEKNLVLETTNRDCKIG